MPYPLELAMVCKRFGCTVREAVRQPRSLTYDVMHSWTLWEEYQLTTRKEEDGDKDAPFPSSESVPPPIPTETALDAIQRLQAEQKDTFLRNLTGN